jgi:hypothetical protein
VPEVNLFVTFKAKDSQGYEKSWQGQFDEVPIPHDSELLAKPICSLVAVHERGFSNSVTGLKA